MSRIFISRLIKSCFHTGLLWKHARLQHTVKNVSDATLSAKYKQKTMEITTCRHLFPQNVAARGLNFKLTYIDERKEDLHTRKENVPVVVMLHGAPGSYHDFELQVEFLLNQGTRVIVPNFPDLQELLKHRSPKVRNSPRNRASFVRDLLQSLGVWKVDMLVAHSGSAYTAMDFTSNKKTLNVRSVALLNPACLKESVLKPRWLYELTEWLTFNRFGYAFFRYFNNFFVKQFNKTLRCTDVDVPLTSIGAITSRSPQESLSLIEGLVNSRLPLLYVFSENDKLNHKDTCYEMLEVLGGNRNNLWVYDEKGNMKSKENKEENLRSVCFEHGSHYSFRRHPDIINKELLNLLNRSLAYSQT